MSESCFDMYDDTHIHYVYSWKYDNKPADDIEEKEMADDFMKVISNNAILTNYIPGYLNQAIHFTGDDMGSDKAMMIVLLYVVIAIMAFVSLERISIRVSNFCLSISKMASGRFIPFPIFIGILPSVMGITFA